MNVDYCITYCELQHRPEEHLFPELPPQLPTAGVGSGTDPGVPLPGQCPNSFRHTDTGKPVGIANVVQIRVNKYTSFNIMDYVAIGYSEL